MTCAECRELLGGYALGALAADEADAVRRHLATCEACRREQEELAGVPPLLGLLDSPEPPPEPPAALEQAVLDRFSRERGRASARRRRWPRPRVLVPAAAAAVAIGALALAGVFSPASDDEAFGHVSLRGGAGASADADLHAIQAGTRVRLQAAGLPSKPSPVYEVWCIANDGRWISGGSFHVDHAGNAEVTLTSAARPGEYEVIKVTRSRAEGVRGPTLLAGDVEY
jgi:anti-sigma-K factor RskA